MAPGATASAAELEAGEGADVAELPRGALELASAAGESPGRTKPRPPEGKTGAV